MHFPQTADTRCLRNVPFIIFVKGTAVMPPYVILRLAEVSTRFFTTFRMTRDCVQNDSEVCKASLRSRRMTNRGATDPILTRRRVLNAHSGYQLFRKAVGSYFILKKTCKNASL